MTVFQSYATLVPLSTTFLSKMRTEEKIKEDLNTLNVALIGRELGISKSTMYQIAKKGRGTYEHMRKINEYLDKTAENLKGKGG